jgi:hypothetical protein
VENDGNVTRRRLFSAAFLPITPEGEAVAIQSAEAVSAIVRIAEGKAHKFHRPVRLSN